jgi:DNA-binding response OmpR family regulator
VPSPRPRVLVIDDEPSVGLLLKYVFTALEIDVEVTNTGRDGLQSLADSAFDVVYVDWNLPDVSGEDVIARARVVRPETPIVVMTAEPEHRVKGRHTGALYLHKPFHLAALEDSFQRARKVEIPATVTVG